MSPLNPLEVPRFGGITTFSRLPYMPEIKRKMADIGILGIPFDGGTTYRPGARMAPRSIRQSSVLNRNFNPELGVDVYQALRAADLGDISVNPLSLQKTFKKIQSTYQAVLGAHIQPIALGGDHSILLPILREIKKKHKRFILIQFDAHTDTADQAWGEKYHHGTPVRRLIEEKILKGPDIFQIGIRGPLSHPSQDEYIHKNKINVLGIRDFYNTNTNEMFFNRIKTHASKLPVYVSFDVDGVDPAYAPGTGTPVVGGMTSFEALESVRKLAGLNIVGADVVEVSPAYDHAEITSLLASALVFEFMSLMAFYRK